MGTSQPVEDSQTERAHAESLRHGAPVVGTIKLAYKQSADGSNPPAREFEPEDFNRPVHLVRDEAQGKVYLIVGDIEGAPTERKVTRQGMYVGQGIDVQAAQADLRKNLEEYGVRGDYTENAQA